MTHDTVQATLNGRFAYAPETGDNWQILPETGPVRGDCEDYSLTLVWLWEGRSILRFWWSLISLKYVFWFCISPTGDGHLVMWCRGRGWTDNIQQKMVRQLPTDYRLRFPYPVPTVALKLLL